MPCDGAIETAADGFVVYLNSNKDQLVPASAVDSAHLTLRQRFTLAHELGHTFFLDAVGKPLKPRPNIKLLESLCNQAAQYLLLPEFLLKKEIGFGRQFDSIEMARDLASNGRVSPEVVLQRMDSLRDLKAPDYALFCLRRQSDGVLQTTGVCFDDAGFGTLQRPQAHSSLPAWVTTIVPENATDGSVHRCTRDHAWEFVGRRVPGNRTGDLLFIEIKIEMRAARAAT
jgi:hypothetical protein